MTRPTPDAPTVTEQITALRHDLRAFARAVTFLALVIAAALTVLFIKVDALAEQPPARTTAAHHHPAQDATRREALFLHRRLTLPPPRPTPTAASRGGERGPVASASKNATTNEVPNLEVHGQVLEVTAYCWTGNRTASGVWPERGMAAGNDWDFGTRLRVEGIGIVTVTDRYGYGTQLDLYLGHYADCEHDALVFGRRHLHVEVVR